MGRWGLASAAVVLGACNHGGDAADSGATDGCTSEDIVVHVGTGVQQYEPLATGAPVTMIHGPQGGWHIETAGLVEHSEPEVSVHPEIVVPSRGDLLIAGTQEASFIALVGYDEEGCQGSFYNSRAFLDTSVTGEDSQAFVCSLAGETLLLSITVTDILSGRSGTSSVEVVAELDAADIEACSGG